MGLRSVGSGMLGLAGLATVLPLAAFAQGLDGTLVLPDNIEITSTGWGQLSNSRELLQFLLDVLETVVFTAALVFHPRAHAHRRDGHDWQVPRTMFLFGLIGMTVGFLVVHHGYLIGFVIFGIGGLFRFRMETSSLMDSSLLILVTLIGLTVGLDLPVMALIATISGWAVVWVFGAQQTVTVEVKFDEKANLGKGLESLEARVREQGYRVQKMSKSKFKPVVELTLSSKGDDKGQRLAATLADLQNDKTGITDWHVV